jgi:hypothetical protein
VPVSIIGTFAVLLALGFSINTLTLFGLVLAIGIVVDDAIVVVENVERNIENGLSPLAAAHQAMREVSGPIIAIALVLVAVFVPISFLSGITGQFYRQFAVTIAISTVISAINSLTLSPALAAVLLRPHGAPPDLPTRVIDRLFGWIFRPFNRGFKGAARFYADSGRPALKRAPLMLIVYVILVGATVMMFRTVPGGFIPTQDKLYLIGGVKLPEGSSLDRTEAVVRKMSDLALSTPGIHDAVAFPGLNALQFNNTPNTGTIFFGLDAFGERTRSAADIVMELSGKLATIQEAFAFAIMPPPILGIGTGSGFSLYVEDRAGLGYGELQNAVNGFAGARHGLSVHLVSVQRAAADRRGRPRQGQGPGPGADRRVRDAADLSRLGLRQRLQPLRPHLPGVRPGRRAVPRFGRGHHRATHAQPERRDGTDRQRGDRRPDLRPRPGDPLQRPPGCGPVRRIRPAHHVLAAGHWHHHRHGAQGPARRHELRVDRPELPAGDAGPCRAGGIPAVRAAGVPGAGVAL